MLTLNHKVAIVTGGRTGIGKATADLFSHEGAEVFILGRKLPEPLSNLVGIYCQCDITNEEQVAGVVSRISSQSGYIDILVNNSGIFMNEGQLTDLEGKVIDEVLATNVKGTLLMSKHVLRKMQKQGSGNIINIASILGTIGTENSAAYTASKGAIIALTRAMAIEQAKYGIRVNSVSPSLVETDMVKEYLQTSPATKKRLLEAHPNKRFIAPAEVAKLILYLASDDSSSISGQNLVIDAGRSIYDR